MARGTNLDVLACAESGVNDDIGIPVECRYLCFGRVLAHFVVRIELLKASPARPSLVSAAEVLDRCPQVEMHNPWTVGLAERIELLLDAYGVDDHDCILG